MKPSWRLRARPTTLSFGGRRLLWSIVLVAASAGNLGCREQSQARTRRGPVGVEVVPVEVRDVPVRLRSIGTVEAVNTVRVISQVTGLVQQVHFKEGDFVKKGELLFTIDTRPYSTNLAAAQAQLAKDAALARQAQQDAERAGKLHAEGLTSAQEYNRAQASAAAAAAALNADRADVQSASLNVQFARVRAPIDGRTGSLLVVAGNVVKANENQPLVVIRSLIPIYVRFSLPEDNLPEVRAHMREGNVAVTATPRGVGGVPARGNLTFIENAVDPSTGTIDLKAEFTNKGYELWPGQFVDVAVDLTVEKHAIVVPESAIQVGQEGTYAYVVGGDKKAHLRHVVVRRTVDEQSVIEKGLKAGERVVTEGQVKLRDGSPVSAKLVPPEKPIDPPPPAQPDRSAAPPRADHAPEPGAGR